MNKADSVVIVSGGMDSVTLLHYLVKELKLKPAVISYLYGQKHSKELEYAKTQAIELGCEHLVIDMKHISPLLEASALISGSREIPNIEEVLDDPQPATYVPNRNMIFLSLAVAFAESIGVNNVYYGAQARDLYGYWDCTEDFLERLNNVYALNRKNVIKVNAPFVHYTKSELLGIGLDLGVDYSKTWTCYRGQEIACGECPTCAERLQAFADYGHIDPIPYYTNNNT